MTTPAQIHNAVGLIVDLYGGLLRSQAEEILKLREQNEFLTAALKQASVPKSRAKGTAHHDDDLDELESNAKLVRDAANADGGKDVRTTSDTSAVG